MGTLIPWSQIHPTITSQTPFVGVVVVDPDRQLCVSELIAMDEELLSTGECAASELIAAAQLAAAAVARAYRDQRTRRPAQRAEGPALRVLSGGVPGGR